MVETPYQDLGWKNLAPRSQPLFTPLIFHSQKNNAIIETTDTLNGKPAVLYADYPNSPVYNFKLKTFYFGCKLATPQQGNGGPAQKCTVSITGTKNDGKKTEPVSQPVLLSLTVLSKAQLRLDHHCSHVANVAIAG